MTQDVDLRDLAYDRGGAEGMTARPPRHLLTRYVIPLMLIGGFVALVAWAARDLISPPQAVTVVPVFATTAEVRQEGAPLFKAAGWIEPRPTPVRVAALAPGVVETLLVVEDQSVEAGEPIAELVKEDARLDRDEALADLEIRRAGLEEARAALTAATTRFQQPVHLQAALSDAEASLAKIQTELTNLPFEIRRAEVVHDAMKTDYDGKRAATGVVAEVEIDVAKSKADSARTLVQELRDRTESLAREREAMVRRRDALQSQLELLVDETQAVDAAQARISAAKAQVAHAQVAVAKADLRLDRMTVVAPIAGRIFRLIAHPGARIGSGMSQYLGHDGSTVVTMYRPDMLQLRVDVRFEDIPKVSLKQLVEIDNPVLSSTLTGSVLFISSEADIQKNTLQVKVEIPDPPPAFRPEMLVDVTFIAPEPPEQSSRLSQEVRLYVLQQLIHQGDDGPFVWIADQSEGIARRTPIKIGKLRSNGLVEVYSGLTESSRIIAGGGSGLQDGDRIKVTSEDASLGANAIPTNGDGTSMRERLPAGDNQ